MTANGVDAGLLDVGGEESGGVLKPEFRAGVCNPEHSEDGDDSDDRDGDDHLHSCEPVLLRGWLLVLWFIYASTSRPILGNNRSVDD